MHLSTKGRYAVMALADLANQDAALVPLASIAERQEISLAYLEQLFLKLRRAGLVSAVRGPGGGYRLTRGATAIMIGEIMNAVDEPVKMTRCAGDEKSIGCIGGDRCLTHDLWSTLSVCINQFLDSISLADVLDRRIPPFPIPYRSAGQDDKVTRAGKPQEASL